ncbi:Bud site selection protein, Revert to axial protein 1 [Ceratobasidium sp. 414]|nr:Bud site selection protein, Revert to axial protein 1 [Ceratobasidium sp. 414]
MSVPAPAPPPIPDPKLNPTTAASSLPLAQLENLRYKITQIIESINGLMITLNAPQPGGIAGGLAAWPELMTKYNVLLSMTHSLTTSLNAPPTRKGQTLLKAIAPHPYATNQPPLPTPGTTQPPAPALDPQQIETMLDVLLDGRRSQSVLRADIANVARLRLPKDSTGPALGFGGGGIRVGGAGASTGLWSVGRVGGVLGVHEGPMTAEELRAEEARLDEVKRAHDARCARGVEAVRQLKDKYDWKSRLLFDDSDTDVGPLDSETGTQHDGEDEPGAQAGEEDDEDMVEVGVAPDSNESPGVGTGADMDTEDGTPTHTVFVPAVADSDSESEDERPLGQVMARGEPTDAGIGVGAGVNGDAGVEGDGSDSDGMEDIAPQFPPPIQPQYNGANGTVPVEPSPVDALENFSIGAMEKSQLPQQRGGHRNRLPTFEEVLSRKTRPPVDLFMFYLFLQREGAEDVLDFWLDVQQHENLCRAYFKDVRKSGRTIREDWPQYWEYARRRGSIYGHVVGLGAGGASSPSSPSTTYGVGTGKRSTMNTTGAQDVDIEKRGRTPSPVPPLSGRPITPGGTGADGYRVARAPSAMDDRDPRSTTPFEKARRTSGVFKRASRAPTILPRDAAITRADLIASAERIFARYLVPGADKEVYLPPALRINDFPLSSLSLPSPTSPAYETESAALAQVPDMFHNQKEYVFRAMEQDAFPRFLRAKAFGNLTPVSALVRLCVGLLVLWIALACAFSLVFLDVKPKSKRFFLFIPFIIAFLLLISHQYELDPILVFLQQSETTPFRTLRIRERYVRNLLLGRAAWVCVLVAVLSVVFTIVFWAVPGRRL